MYALQVEKMTCGGCAARVTQAVRAVDPAAQVQVELQQKLVRVESTASATEVVHAITAAGYPAALPAESQ